MKETTNKKESENPRTLERINGKYIWNEIISVLIFEKGILFTLKELFIRPAYTIRWFLHNIIKHFEVLGESAQFMLIPILAFLYIGKFSERNSSNNKNFPAVVREL